MANVSPANHRSQYVSYRVFAYRLRFPTSYALSIGPGKQVFDLNYIFRIDTADRNYRTIATHFEDDDHLQELISSTSDAIKNGLSAGVQGLLDKNSLFEVIELTPLVTAININLQIAGTNTCSLAFLDHAHTDFGQKNAELTRDNGPAFLNLNQLPVDANKTLTEQQKQARERQSATHARWSNFESLRGFVLKEFDFIRVEEYAREEESWADRSAGFLEQGISSDFTSTVGFTGIVTSISRNVGVDGVPRTVAQCASMHSVFDRGTAIFSRAIAQQISEKGGKYIKTTDIDMNTLATAFQGMSSLTIFRKLMNDYFLSEPGFNPPDAGEDVNDSLNALCMPFVNPDKWEKLLTKEYKLVQFLPTLLCYHILKYINLEPVYILDDLLNEKRVFMRDESASGRIELPEPAGRKDYIDYLTPYLSMIRTSYEIYNSSYQNPTAILDEVRSKSFFEIFEDRAGTFHFRFPRYNECKILHTCKPEDTSSATLVKSDSAIFNVAQSENMMQLMGSLTQRGAPPALYFDRFSIFRYGMRMPQMVENPNAVVSEMANEIARYVNGYNSALTSRTATVTRVLDPRINIGEMVRFYIGPSEKMLSGPMDSGEFGIYVGYVVGINESLSVSGNSSQTLELAMVREVGIGDEAVADEKYRLTFRQAADTLKPGKDGYTGVVSEVKELQEIARLNDIGFEDLNNLDQDYLMPEVPLSVLGGSSVAFKYVPDPIVVAYAAGIHLTKHKKIVGSATQDDKQHATPSDIKRSLRQLNARLSARAANLSASLVYGTILNSYMEKMKDQLKLTKTTINTTVKVRALGNALIKNYYDVLREKRKEVFTLSTTVLFKFHGAKGTTESIVSTKLLDNSLDALVEKASGFYRGVEVTRRGADWYKKEWNRLFKYLPEIGSGTNLFSILRRFRSEQVSEYDAKSAVIIAEHFVNDFLPREIASLSYANLQNDKEAVELTEKINKLRSELNELSKAATFPTKSQVANSIYTEGTAYEKAPYTTGYKKPIKGVTQG